MCFCHVHIDILVDLIVIEDASVSIVIAIGVNHFSFGSAGKVEGP
jgi:hypothetical protein